MVFKGTGHDGGGHNGDLALGGLTGNGTVTLIGRNEGLMSNTTFTAAGGLPYNVVVQTTSGVAINGMFGSSTDTLGGGNLTVAGGGATTLGGQTINTGGGNISVVSSGALTLSGPTLNAGTGNISLSSTSTLTLNGTLNLTGNQVNAFGNYVYVNGALNVNAVSSPVTITGTNSGSAGIVFASPGQTITTTGNVTFVGTSSAGSYIDGISLAGTFNASSGTLTFNGTASSGGAYGIEDGVSGSWGNGSNYTYGNVVFSGAGGTTRNSDLNLGTLTGNGNVTLIGRFKGLNTNINFTESGGLPYNVNIQTTNGASINGMLGSGTDTTGGGSYTINSAGSVTFGGRTINTGAGTISLTSASGYSVTANSSLLGGSLVFGDTKGIAISSGMTLTLNATGSIPNAISGSGSLAISGGAITLTGSNTYGGSTTISAGTLQVGGGATGTLGSGSVSDNATLAFGRSDSGLAVSNAISGNGTVAQVGPGLTKLSSSNGYSGGTLVSAGTLQIGNLNALGSGGLNLSSGILDLNTFGISLPSLAGGGIVTDNSSGPGTTTLTLSPTNNISFNGSLQNGPAKTLALSMTGAGMLTLSGSNAYTGPTSVNGGTLAVNGSLAAGTTVNVATAGTLMGSGTLSGNATLTGNGVINLASAGIIGGTLTATGGNWNGQGSVTGAANSTSGLFTIGSGATLTAVGGLNISGGSLAGVGTIGGSVVYGSTAFSQFGGGITGAAQPSPSIPARWPSAARAVARARPA